jgi:hypothetical protein
MTIVGAEARSLPVQLKANSTGAEFENSRVEISNKSKLRYLKS